MAVTLPLARFTMARASTTQKITHSVMNTMRSIFKGIDGVIVRHQGVEHGVIGINPNGHFVTMDFNILDPKACTVRKGLTVEEPVLAAA